MYNHCNPSPRRVPASRSTGPIQANVTNPVTNNDTNGVVKLSNHDGVTRRKNFSIVARTQAAAKIGKTVPWYPTLAILNPNTSQYPRDVTRCRPSTACPL